MNKKRFRCVLRGQRSKNSNYSSSCSRLSTNQHQFDLGEMKKKTQGIKNKKKAFYGSLFDVVMFFVYNQAVIR